MSRIVYTNAVAHRDVDLSWMIGCLITNVTFHEPRSWKFSLGKDRSIGVECLWRLVTDQGTAVTSEDHNQRFGLQAPVDAAAKCFQLVANSSISSVRLNEVTADLTLAIGKDLSLEIVTTSAGYENWQIHDPNGANYVAGGNGAISKWKA
jgi:hypothetical protein